MSVVGTSSKTSQTRAAPSEASKWRTLQAKRLVATQQLQQSSRKLSINTQAVPESNSEPTEATVVTTSSGDGAAPSDGTRTWVADERGTHATPPDSQTNTDPAPVRSPKATSDNPLAPSLASPTSKSSIRARLPALHIEANIEPLKPAGVTARRPANAATCCCGRKKAASKAADATPSPFPDSFGVGFPSPPLPSPYLLLPSHRFKRLWDSYVVILLIYTCISLPVRIAFYLYDDIPSWDVWELLIDISFMIDILLAFNTAVELEGGGLLLSRRTIILRYLTTYFATDALGSIPFYLIFAKGALVFRTTRLLRLPRILRVLRLMRLFKMSKVFNMRRHMYQLAKYIPCLSGVSPAHLRMVKFLVLAIVCLHWAACGFVAMASVVNVVTIGDGDDAYTIPADDTWIVAHGFALSDVGELYVGAFYWAMQTLATVGYGDIQCHSTAERIYAIVVMGCAVTFFGYITASMSTYLESADQVAKARRDATDRIESYMKAKHLSRKLRNRIRDHYLLQWNGRGSGSIGGSQARAYDESVLEDMPADLQFEVVSEVYRDVLSLTPLFQRMDHHFTATMLRYCTSLASAAGSVLCKEGAVGSALYIVATGSVCFQTWEGVPFLNLHPGDIFGEVALLATGKHVCSVVAKEFVEVLVIPQQTLARVLADWPEFEAELLSLCVRRLQTMKGARAKAAAARAAAAAIQAAQAAALGGKEISAPQATRGKRWSVGDIARSIVSPLSRDTPQTSENPHNFDELRTARPTAASIEGGEGNIPLDYTQTTSPDSSNDNARSPHSFRGQRYHTVAERVANASAMIRAMSDDAIERALTTLQDGTLGAVHPAPAAARQRTLGSLHNNSNSSNNGSGGGGVPASGVSLVANMGLNAVSPMRRTSIPAKPM